MGRLIGRITTNAVLNLKDTLKGGQTFRFRFSEAEDRFYGIVQGILVGLSSPSTSKELRYEIHGITLNKWQEKWKKVEDSHVIRSEIEALLNKYLTLENGSNSLEALISTLSKNVILQSPQAFQVRVLAQERFETLIAFITSANNNIERITGLLAKLCEEFGEEIYPLEAIEGEQARLLETIDPTFSTLHSGFRHAFPSPTSIWKASKSREELTNKLRVMGFGYRAPYLAQTIETLATHVDHPFYHTYNVDDLRDYEKCVTALQTLQGVGKKVADCIALQGFHFGFSVPIDVHIRRITLNEFTHERLIGLKNTGALNLTDYKKIGDFYRHSFGQLAGLAQQVMFVHSLNSSKSRLQVVAKPTRKRKTTKEARLTKRKIRS